MSHDETSERSSAPRRLDDQLALLRADLRTFQSSAIPAWFVPAVVCGVSVIVLLSGVLLTVLVFMMLKVHSLESDVRLYQTWAITHRHEGGPQPDRHNLPIPKE